MGDRAVIGAYYDVINGSTLGSAHTFNRNGSAWTEDLSLTEVDLSSGNCDLAAGDLFGYSVALGDSFAVVGSMKDHNENGSDAGAAYIYNLCNYALAGDLNDDCRVDFQDVAVLAANWLTDCIENATDPACTAK